MTIVEAAAIVPLNSNKVPLSHPVGRAVQILNMGGRYLVAVTRHPKDGFHVFRLPDLQFLYTWSGPSSWSNSQQWSEEFVLCSPENDRFTVVNAVFALLGHYRVTDTEIVSLQRESLHHQFRAEPLSGVACLGDRLYFIDNPLHWSGQHPYIALEPGKKEPLFAFGSYLNNSPASAEKAKHDRTLNVAKPDGSRFAAFYPNHDRFRIYNGQGRLLHDLQVAQPEAKKDVSQSPATGTRTRTRGQAYAGTRHLYTMAQRNALHGADPENPANPILEVWDWDGKSVGRIRLEHNMTAFTVCERHGKIYGVTAEADQVVYEYDMTGLNI